MRKENTKAVFFDLDHTLWDFEKNSELALKKIFADNNVEVDLVAFLKEYVPINSKYWKLYRDGNITQQELRYGRLKEAFDNIGYTIHNELIHILSKQYVDNLPLHNHLYEGALEILDYLKPKYSLHIITNGFQELQDRKLKNANIDHYFTTITNSEIAGCKKPNPLIFEFALNAAKADKETSIMIGDCIEADVQGALDFGLDAIYFNEHKLAAHTSILQINHLLELKNIL
jgi:YjjG family noncanonical pyrimidine nucleotidase